MFDVLIKVKLLRNVCTMISCSFVAFLESVFLKISKEKKSVYCEYGQTRVFFFIYTIIISLL